jgi:hypothetical protein
MVPMNTNPDDWIASVGSYVRNSFGNRGALIQPADVKRLRDATKERKQPFTVEELAALLPAPLKNSKEWKLTASHNAVAAANACDGKEDTRFDTKGDQAPGQWFQVELPATTSVCGVKLDAGKSRNDYPRGYKVEVSTDGKSWGKPIIEGKGTAGMTEIAFPAVTTKFIRITQTGSAKGTFWSIHEMQVITPQKDAGAAAPTNTKS